MKTKKILCILLVLIIAIGFASIDIGTTTASAATLDEADMCLEETINFLYPEEEHIYSLDYYRKEIYNYRLLAFGYAYTISLNNSTGYALMINRGSFYEITEIYLNADMPYFETTGLAVYLTPMSYIEFVDGQYYDIRSGEILDEYILTELEERGFGFRGGYPIGQNITETVTYTSKTEDEYRIPGTFPSYINMNGNLPNTCAVTAGTTAVGYYGRWFPELVPNHTVGKDVSGSYYYYPQSSAVQPTIEDLYFKMGCNVGGAGTTAEGFRNGIKTYCQGKGKSVSYTNVVNNNQLNLTSYKNLLNEAKPVALFFNTYNMIGENAIRTNENTDTITRQYYGGMHVVISFGYKFIKYYNGNTNFRTDYYVRVATGVLDMRFGYVRLYDNAIIQEGHSIHIY